jgi:hypothetical protein
MKKLMPGQIWFGKTEAEHKDKGLWHFLHSLHVANLQRTVTGQLNASKVKG